MIPDQVDQAIDFIVNVLVSLFSWLRGNEIVLAFFMVPVVTFVIFVVIEILFTIRDDFSNAMEMKDKGQYMRYSFRNYQNRQKRLDMDEVYRKQRENADYKHKLKMEEYDAFSANAEYKHAMKMEEIHYYHENEEKRHQHKHEESKEQYDLNAVNPLEIIERQKHSDYVRIIDPHPESIKSMSSVSNGVYHAPDGRKTNIDIAVEE